MQLNKAILIFTLFIIPYIGIKAQVINSSYVKEFGEKALQLSIIVPNTKAEVWKLFTTDKRLATVVTTNIKIGGWIKTNYDETKTTDDSSAIQLDIINYLENEMLTVKVNLNDNFSERAQNEDKNLQEIIQFVDMGNGKTRIISAMIGWGEGTD